MLLFTPAVGQGLLQNSQHGANNGEHGKENGQHGKEKQQRGKNRGQHIPSTVCLECSRCNALSHDLLRQPANSGVFGWRAMREANLLVVALRPSTTDRQLERLANLTITAGQDETKHAQLSCGDRHTHADESAVLVGCAVEFRTLPTQSPPARNARATASLRHRA